LFYKENIMKKTLITLLCLIFLLVGLVMGDWPNFHGPNSDNKSPDTGLLKSWPEQGPKLLWKASGLGQGFSSVIITDNKIFTAGFAKERTYVLAFDLNGKLLWKKPNGKGQEDTGKR